MFNMTNTPQWNPPGQTLGQESSFGFVNGAGGRRTMQMGLKLYF